MTTKQDIPESERHKWIWPFELLEQIGEGGMGQVYRARYVVNDREVALKMLPRDVTDKTTLARFERELAVLKNLKHPNIVRCFGGSCENDRRFYAMELVEGGTLEDKLEERKRLPWEQIVFYGLQMCDALECSHEKGVIHRDLKPSNFLLTKAGQLKLSDFGLASVAASRKITAAGKTAGTFLYMAPEQIRGHEVSPQTDLYALGCVLYELVTGEPPFIGETPAATLHMHCKNTPVRPTEKNMECPLALEQIILDLLQKEAEKRPESAAVVAQRLKSVKQTVTMVSTPTERVFGSEASSIPKPGTSSTAFFKPEMVARTQVIPSWVIVALFISLVCSLAWNLIGAIQKRIPNRGEAAWVESALSGDPTIRVKAIHVIGEIASEHGRNLHVFEQGLKDEEKAIRLATIEAIGKARGHAKRFAPKLLALAKSDSDPDVRTKASNVAEELKNARIRYDFPVAGTVIAGVILLVSSAGIYFWVISSMAPEQED